MANNPTIILPPVETFEAEEVTETTEATALAQVPSQQLQTQAQHALQATGDGLLTLASAELLVRSGILPKTIKTPEAAIAIALNGRDLGISATVAFNNIWLLDGKPSLSAGLVTALANRAGIRFVWSADKENVLDEAGNVIDWKWEVLMIEKWEGELLKNKMQLLWTECVAAGWTGKDPWKKHPRAMARARLIVQVIKAHRPDVLMGLSSFEELSDSRGGESYRYNPQTNTTELLS